MNADSDVKTETATEQRRREVLNQMAEREKLRKDKEEALRASRLSNRQANESNDLFKDKWSTSVKLLDAQMHALDAQGQQLNVTSLTEQLDALLDRAEVLQQSLTDAVHFLLPHTHQQAKEEFVQLYQALHQQRDRLLPKKKFAFGARKPGAAAKPAAPVPTPALPAPVPQSVSVTPLLHDLVDESVALPAEQLADRDVLLSDLRDCEVRLCGPAATLHAARLERCTLLCAPVARSIFLEDCVDCTLVLACQQLRVHGVRDSRIYLRVTSRAIIEDCRGLQLAPYALQYGALFDQHLRAAGLADTPGHWDHVDDFNHLVRDEASPNWSVLPVVDRRTWTEL